MVVDLFLVYQFIRRLATPFNKWKAYDLGIIDEKGKVLIKRKDFTKKAQSEAWGIFDIMIANLKKLLAKVPGGSSRLASYAAALFLIKEFKAFTDESMLTEDLTEEDIENSLLEFHNRYNHYTMLAESVNQKIHPAVIKAYKKSLDAEHRDAEYGTSITKRAVTRTANTLSKKINQHHPDLDMQGKIKLRTQLQNMREEADLQEAQKVRWKRAGNNGEIQATIGGKKYQIEKALDHNERHKGEWKVMVWDKRRDSWEWETTEYGKANAKAWIMDRLKESSCGSDSKKSKVNTKPTLDEEPANNVGSGNIAGMDAGHMSKAAQKRWTSKNKSKRRTFRDIIGRT